MIKQHARDILYQLVEARRLLEGIHQGKVEDPKEAAIAYFFRFVRIDKQEVDIFFATPAGQRLANEFGM